MFMTCISCTNIPEAELMELLYIKAKRVLNAIRYFSHQSIWLSPFNF